MRSAIIILLTLFATLTVTAKNRIIINPTVEYTPYWICINEIEFAKDATILRCELRHRPHWWVKIDGAEYLKDRDSDRVWKFLKVEGVELGKETWMPDEGHVPCTLYFEPVAADVKEVNLNGNEYRPEDIIYGIQLTPPDKNTKKSDTINPRTMTADYYLGQTFTPDTAWRFSPERYRDMRFYSPGKAHVEVVMDNLSHELRDYLGSLSVNAEDQILRRKVTLAPTLTDDNRYVMDIDLAGPMTLVFSQIGTYFVQPGDTLEIFTTAEQTPYRERLHTAFQSNSETAMINALLPRMLEQLGVVSHREVAGRYRKAAEEGKESCERLAGEWGTIAENILTSEDVRQTLINTPLSTFGKDLMMTYALAEMGENIEDIRMSYDDDRYIIGQDSVGNPTLQINPDFVPLDKERFYATQLRHRDCFYDNPLVLCTGWPYVNRTVFGGLFLTYSEMVEASEGNYVQRQVDQFGMKGTFMYDIMNSQSFSNAIESFQRSVRLGTVQPGKGLDMYNHGLAEYLAAISYPPVVKVVLDEYHSAVARLEGGKEEADEDKWNDEQRALWNKITAPYEGNLLYVDFWGMGCGPCRSGMLSMRDNVEALKDDDFRFLYVCDETHSPRDDAEKWMEENSIKGEHIYVTPNEWNQLEQMFNFTAIPHAVLADKQGKIIQNGFHIDLLTVDQLREIIANFE